MLKGQLTDRERKELIELAVETRKDIYISGTLAETKLGLARRYVATAVRQLGVELAIYTKVAKDLGISTFRIELLKTASRLVGEGVGDIDLINGKKFSNLDEKERAKLKSIFPDSFELDHKGYSDKYYKEVEDLGEEKDGPGALVFMKTGEVQRILAKYQY